MDSFSHGFIHEFLQILFYLLPNENNKPLNQDILEVGNSWNSRIYGGLSHHHNVAVSEFLMITSAENEIPRTDQTGLTLLGRGVEHRGEGEQRPRNGPLHGWSQSHFLKPLIVGSRLFREFNHSEMYEAYFGNWKGLNMFS